tara:strand:- start:4525 stop:4911 length:387 start_codon:yes stop_codon:yes gene_type:complete
MIAISALYAAIFGLAMTVLSVSVALGRGKYKVGYGDGDEPRLRRLIRIHGNFAEYVPLALVLLLVLELTGVEPVFLHGLGLTLVVARIVHVIGLIGEQDVVPARAGGTGLTNLVIGVAALGILRQLFS